MQLLNVVLDVMQNIFQQRRNNTVALESSFGHETKRIVSLLAIILKHWEVLVSTKKFPKHVDRDLIAAIASKVFVFI
jgi:hypothetical protein